MLLLRPPIFELDAVDDNVVDEEVESIRDELMLEGRIVPTAPSVAPPWVLFPGTFAVAAKTVVDTLGVAVGVVGAAGDQDVEGDVNVEVVASMLLSSQPSPP